MSSTSEESGGEPQPGGEEVQVTEAAAAEAISLLESEEMDTDVAGLLWRGTHTVEYRPDPVNPVGETAGDVGKR